jgi:uncharacterized protein YcbK (DUF882 family)
LAKPFAIAELAARMRRLRKALAEAPRAAPQTPAVDGFFFRACSRFFQEARPQDEQAQLHAVSGRHTAARLWKMEREDVVSRFFKAQDVWPPDPACAYVRISPKLLELLDELREKVGPTFRIVSGYRTPGYNRSVSGRGFLHVDGLAAHVTASAQRSALLCQLADELFQGGGVGFYPGRRYVHVDVSGDKARWRQEDEGGERRNG